jgi:hypothetical protein
MVEKDRLLRELDSTQDRLRKASDGHGREQPGPGSGGHGSSMALLLTQPQPDTQHVHREELRVGSGTHASDQRSYIIGIMSHPTPQIKESLLRFLVYINKWC